MPFLNGETAGGGREDLPVEQLVCRTAIDRFRWIAAILFLPENARGTGNQKAGCGFSAFFMK